MSTLFNGLVQEHRSRLKEAQLRQQALVKKWGSRTPLLQGIKDNQYRGAMAQLLENQLSQLITEANATNPGGANSEEWSGVALPLVRRVFMDIVAKNFVSIQTMNQPSGLVFYLDFKFGSTAKDGGVFSGDVYGNTSSSGDPVGGFYGSGRFGYSKPDKEADLATGKIAVASASWDDVGYSAALSGAIAAKQIAKVSFPITDLTRPDKASIMAWRITGSSIAGSSNLPIFTTLLNSSGVPIFVQDPINDTAAVSASIYVSASALAAAATHIFYTEQTDASNRGDFEDRDSSATALPIPTFDVALRSEPIVATTRKLKAVWSTEYAQDLAAYHALDAEAEITQLLTQHISTEIDLELLSMLIQAGRATNKERWSALIAEVFSNGVWAASSAGGDQRAETQGSWFQTLGTKIQKLSNQIHSKTMRGGANFLVCSPKVATILESIPGYAAMTNGDQMQFGMGVQQVGTVNQRLTVYKNPYMNGEMEHVILVGYRGNTFLETGAVFAPYIPLLTSPTVFDPENFTPRKSIMTRYAKKVLRPEFYGVIEVKSLDTI